MILKKGRIYTVSKENTAYCCTIYTLTNLPIITIVSGDKNLLQYQSEQLREILGQVDNLMDLAVRPD